MNLRLRQDGFSMKHNLKTYLIVILFKLIRSRFFNRYFRAAASYINRNIRLKNVLVGFLPIGFLFNLRAVIYSDLNSANMEEKKGELEDYELSVFIRRSGAI